MAKIIQFFIEVKSELAKVVWPSKSDTVRYTALVIAFSLVVAIVLGAADLGLVQLLQKLVSRG